MATLLIRLCGPMQSWGTRSRWSERDTELEPSLSGVIGLLCAAKGVARDEPIPPEWLSLRMGVRVDHEGVMARDYHTAGGAYPVGVARADGGHLSYAVLSNRYYLADADFLVGLEHDQEEVLRAIEAGLRNPRWQLFLGRKSFVPAVPLQCPRGVDGEVASGIRALPLAEALANEPAWRPLIQRRERMAGASPRRYVIQCSAGATSSEIRMDQPLAASFNSRRFQLRYVETTFEHPKENPDA